MQYIVIDFEFNQAFDFENNCPMPPFKDCRFEIIQIGAVKLNEKFEVVDSFNNYIKPTLYKKIHPYVKKVTSISEDDLINAANFKDVIKKFFKFIEIEKPYILCVWGSNDIKVLYRNLNYYKLIKNDSLILRYIDLQSVTASYLKYNKGGAIGLKTATELLKIESKNEFHNALNDAIYTAEILQKLYKTKLDVKIFNSKYI